MRRDHIRTVQALEIRRTAYVAHEILTVHHANGIRGRHCLRRDRFMFAIFQSLNANDSSMVRVLPAMISLSA